MVGAGFLLIQSSIEESDPILMKIFSEKLSISILFKQITNNEFIFSNFCQSLTVVLHNNDFLQLLCGLIFGWTLVWMFAKYVQRQDESEITFESLQGRSASQVLVVLLTMTCHSLGEGASIGVAEGLLNMDNIHDKNLSWSVILTLAIHNIPEGFATALFLVGRGMTKTRAILWSVMCDVPLPLTAVPAYLFVEQFSVLLNACLGFAAGAMFYISFVELIPECLLLLETHDIEMRKDQKTNKTNTTNNFISERAILVLVFVISISFVFAIAN